MLHVDESHLIGVQLPVAAGKKRANEMHKVDNQSLKGSKSEFFYIMVHNDDVSMWNARVFDDGSHQYQEMDFEQFGITDDDLRHAISLGEKDYFDTARNADPAYYPISPHIESKLKILNPL